MNVEIKGTVKKVNATEAVSDNFSKRTVIVQEDVDKYPAIFQIEFINNKTELPDKLNEGDTVTFNCNLNGREWESPTKGTMYFLSLNCWKMEVNESVNDDLPFE